MKDGDTVLLRFPTLPVLRLFMFSKITLHILSFGIVLCFLMGLSGCDDAKKPMAFPPAVVQVSPVTMHSFNDRSNYLATVKSRKSVTLSPNVAGHVTHILVGSGQLVQKGQKLIQIDSGRQIAEASAVELEADSAEADLASMKATLSSLESTLKSKQANVEYTKTQHARYQRLRNEGAVSQSDLDSWTNNSTAAIADRDSTMQQIAAHKLTINKYERNHKRALANFEAQKEQLKYYEIRAPFAGVVGDIPIKVGDRVTSDSLLTTLTENHPLEVYVSVPAEKASSITPGMQVALLSSDGKVYGDSKVIFIAPTVDPSSQTVLVKTLYPNERSELRADQTVKAQIVWKSHDVVSVPTKAVLQAAGKYYVFVAAESSTGAQKALQARQTEIEVYEIEGSSYQVKSGLKPTDRIVMTGIQRLFDGAPIQEKSEIGVSGAGTPAEMTH